MDMTEDSHLENIRAIAELKAQVSNVAADVSTVVKQMDMVWQLQNQMARMQQEQVDHKDTIKRLAGRIELSETSSLESKATAERWINRGVGAFAVGSVLFGFIQFLVLKQVDNYESRQHVNTELLTTLDRRMAWVEYELKNRKLKEIAP